MRTKLIAALRAAVDEVEKDPSAYNWQAMEKCNCGVVANHLIGREAVDEIRLSTDPFMTGIWRDIGMKAEKCSATGLWIPSLIQSLLDAGLSGRDICDLEHLANKSVLDALGVPEEERICGGDWESYDKPSAFIAYARKWAELLEKEEA